MSKRQANEALNRMNLREVMLCSTYGGLQSDMKDLAEANADTEHAAAEVRITELASAYGFGSRDEAKPFLYYDGVAVIPIHGTLINRFNYCWGYVTGYGYIRRMRNAAEDDPDVQKIVYDVNSFGGEAAACFELAAEIASGKKPSMAVIDSNCMSAAYALVSGCDKIVCTPSGYVGSIGVIAMHMDISKMMADWGIKVTIIAEGEHKADGNPYEPLSKEVLADIRASVTKRYGEFCDLVASHRGLDSQAVRDTQSRSFRADDALALKLIDKVMTPTEAVSEFLAELGSDEPANEDTDQMTTEATKPTEQASAPDVNQVAADARTAERARVAGILGHEEAAGRSALAQHFATNTDMSVEAAVAALKVAPKEAAAAPAAAEPADPKDTSAQDAAHGNAFNAAMGNTANPNVGTNDKEGGSEATSENATSRILASQAKATGRKLENA
jgi:signal peptide peptidase SppA